jgi:hypothetical protein
MFLPKGILDWIFEIDEFYILCNVFEENFKCRVIDDFQTKPYLFLRYVDGIYVDWTEKETQTLITTNNDLHNNFNSLSLHIKFTLEREKEGVLALSTYKSRKLKKLETAVFRKPTDSSRYLQYGSNHP